MKHSTLDLLACPVCHGELELAAEPARAEVVEGCLRCLRCG